MFQFLHELGYEPRARNWSPGVAELISPEAGAICVNDTAAFDYYESHPSTASPFTNLNYMQMQIEVGVDSTYKEINESPHGRNSRWIVGYGHIDNTMLYTTVVHYCLFFTTP